MPECLICESDFDGEGRRCGGCERELSEQLDRMRSRGEFDQPEIVITPPMRAYLAEFDAFLRGDGGARDRMLTWLALFS